MICLGHIDHRVICVPDYEQLIGSAASWYGFELRRHLLGSNGSESRYVLGTVVLAVCTVAWLQRIYRQQFIHNGIVIYEELVWISFIVKITTWRQFANVVYKIELYRASQAVFFLLTTCRILIACLFFIASRYTLLFILIASWSQKLVTISHRSL